MPLHFTGMTTRRSLDHPDEESPKPVLSYELVLKGNPYHDKASGRFTSPTGGGKPVRYSDELRERDAKFYDNQPNTRNPNYRGPEGLPPIPNPHNIPGLESADQDRTKAIRDAFASQKPGEILSIGPSGVHLSADDGEAQRMKAIREAFAKQKPNEILSLKTLTFTGSIDKSGQPTKRSSFS